MTEIKINSFDGNVKLSVFVHREKTYTSMFFSAYKKLASIAKLSFCFDEAVYIINDTPYYISANFKAHRFHF